jgi:hypothetical protein
MEEISEGTREDLWRTLQTVSDWLKFADAKAGATLAVDGAILALLAGRLRGSPKPEPSTIVALFCAIALAAFSGLLAVWAVMPRTRRLGADSMVHYGTIAKFESAARYCAVSIATLADANEFAKTITRHIWTISRVAAQKYLLVIWSIRFLAGALAVGVLTLLM